MRTSAQSGQQSENGRLKSLNNNKRANRGSSLVETVVGCIFIVIIALFLVDVAAIVICQTQNDALAKHCARAASNFEDKPKAQVAVDDVVNQFLASNGGSKICVFNNTVLEYPAGSAQVLVVSTVVCNFPVPIPLVGTSSIAMKSEATEPVVADVVPPN
ncbi:hypothetical protein BH11CYA1_BH11CYA1_44360 [soil metagenome]